jgi:hypothetical protein
MVTLFYPEGFTKPRWWSSKQHWNRVVVVESFAGKHMNTSYSAYNILQYRCNKCFVAGKKWDECLFVRGLKYPEHLVKMYQNALATEAEIGNNKQWHEIKNTWIATM